MKSTFTVRKITKEPRLFHRLAITSAILFTLLGIRTLVHEAHLALCGSVNGCVPVAGARESFVFNLLPWKEITIGPKDDKKERVVRILKEAGFPEDKLAVAYAVAFAESGARPEAFNGNASTGDKSYGMFQINMIGNLGPARRKQHGLKSNEELYDPLVNAKVAYAISNGGENWRPWGAYTNGSYKRYLSDL